MPGNAAPRAISATPAPSESTPAAPRATASAANRAPWVVAPGSAANRSPGRTSWARRVNPVMGNSGTTSPVTATAPIWAASTRSDVPAPTSGRSAPGTDITSIRCGRVVRIGPDTT